MREKSSWLWARFAVLYFLSFYSSLTILTHFAFFLFLNNLQLLNFLEHESHLNRTVSVLLCLQEFDDISGGEKKDMDVSEGRKGKNNIRKKNSFSCSELCHGSWGLLNWWSVKSSFSNVKSCRLSPALYFTLGSQFS